MSLSEFSVIIVGAGFGGLCLSIELQRQGAKVKVFEAVKDFTRQGDVISIGANGTRILKRWDDDIFNKILDVSATFKTAEIYNKDGRLLLVQETKDQFDGYPAIFTGRGRLHSILYEYALSLGVEVKLGAKISQYFEDNKGAGIFYGEEKHVADFVIAADGTRTLAKAAISGKQEKPVKSGIAIYRAWFPLDHLSGHPLTKPLSEATQSNFKVWVDRGAHGIITTNVKLKHVAVFITHTDHADITESWHHQAGVEEMLRCVPDWDEIFKQVVRSIPEGNLIDYKIMHRNPVKQWVSKNGFIALLGDAAHPHLATSATGGAQAFEDAATIVALLEHTGKANIPLALRAYEALRYERTSLTQRLGWETRHRWHFTDWEAVANDPELIKFPQPLWLQCHDAVGYAHRNYEVIRSHLENGTAFKSTNVPEGHIHEDWTIEEMKELEMHKVTSGFFKAAVA